MTPLEVVNDGVVMVAVLLPEFVQGITLSLLDDKLTVTNLQSFLFESFDDFGFGVFLIKGKVSFGFVESNVR